MPTDLQTKIADLLPTPQDRASLAAASKASHAATAPLIARDKLGKEIGQTSNLADCHKAIQQLAMHTPSWQAQQIGTLADRIETMPMEQRTQAFDAIFKATEKLPPENTARPLIRLSFQVAELPDTKNQNFTKLFDTAKQAYSDNKLSPQNYSQALAGLAYSLPSISRHEQEGAVKQILAQIDKLPTQAQAFPIRSLGAQIGQIHEDARAPAYDAAWSKIAHFSQDNQAGVLGGLASSVHSFPNVEKRQATFDQIFTASTQLPPHLAGEILTNLSPQIAYIPEAGRQAAFLQVSNALTPAHGQHYVAALQQLAQIPGTLPLAARTEAFDQVHAGNATRLEPAALSIATALLSLSISHLPPEARTSRFEQISHSIAQLPAANQSLPTMYLETQRPSLPG